MLSAHKCRGWISNPGLHTLISEEVGLIVAGQHSHLKTGDKYTRIEINYKITMVTIIGCFRKQLKELKFQSRKGHAPR